MTYEISTSYTNATFATVGVGSEMSTFSSNYMADTAFPQLQTYTSHIYHFALWRLKTCYCRKALKVMMPGHFNLQGTTNTLYRLLSIGQFEYPQNMHCIQHSCLQPDMTCWACSGLH